MANRPPPYHPDTNTVLVLGLVSLFCALCGPLAWVKGKRALDEINAADGTLGGRGNVLVGYVLGIITSIVLMLFLLVFIGAMIAGAVL
ncbi:DUF4190 domain-containing protein [Nocardia carnea]|uniref:DUF4190 domain-containing protein n=1 Tax=Nocardia carnea TaxID=37328 RepID=UPI0024541C51|nr:DUF4190 domain-containing protein [Nocardia carnea]